MRPASSRNRSRIDVMTLAVLFLSLVGYPFLRSSGLIPAPDTGSRADWWFFWLIVGVGHWTCFALVALALRSGGGSWESIGLDWNWFQRHWKWLSVVGFVLIVTAFVAPRLYYGTVAPVRNGLFPLQPTTTAERLCWILGGVVTAGIVEETIFRGFGLTRLGRLLGNAWLALPVTIVGFIFLHGTPSSLAMAANYAAPGIVFGIAFILMKCRRLEILILVHGGINAVYLFLP